MASKRLRKLVLNIHGAIAIWAGLLLMVISLTGASIVFHEELDQALNRSLWFVTPQAEQVSFDTIFTSAQAKHPKLLVQYISVPQEPDRAYLVVMNTTNKQQLQTFVNPYTGQVLGSRVWERSLIGFLYTLHHDLFLGKFGQIIVGITGVLLLIMAISGAILWTGWRKLATGFKVRWNAPFAIVNYDIHQVSGIVSNLFLLIISLTGVLIVIVHFLPMFNQTPETKIAPQKASLALSKLLSKADATMPDGKTTFIGLSQPQKLTINKRLPAQETGRFDLSTVELDRYSGEVLQANKVLKPDPFFKVLVALADLHFGTFGGVLSRLLYVLIGLIPTVLLITGLVNWKRRRWRMKRQESTSQLLIEENQSNQIL